MAFPFDKFISNSSSSFSECSVLALVVFASSPQATKKIRMEKENNVNFWRANLSNANLENCSLQQANLKRVNFENANMNGAIFHFSIIRNAKMDGATAIRANFSKTKIKKTNLKNVKFCETIMPYGIDNSGCD